MLRLVLAATAGGIKDAPRRWRIIHKLYWRPHGARREIAAAVGTDAFKTVVDAIATERALECADHCVGRGWRQILIAAFTAWTEFEHFEDFLCGYVVVPFYQDHASRLMSCTSFALALQAAKRKPRSVPVET